MTTDEPAPAAEEPAGDTNAAQAVKDSARKATQTAKQSATKAADKTKATTGKAAKAAKDSATKAAGTLRAPGRPDRGGLRMPGPSPQRRTWARERRRSPSPNWRRCTTRWTSTSEA